MSSSCDIIIPVWNQPEITRKCLESIVLHTPEPHNLIIIDNGSDEPTKAVLGEYEGRMEMTIISNSENMGFAKAMNQGIEASTAKMLCFLNNDVTVTEGWLKELIEVALLSPEIGLVNPLTTNAAKILGDFPENRERFYYSETAKGFCLVARREVVEAVGGWDERFKMGFSEDRDFSRRAEKAGFRPVVAVKAFVHHEESASFKLRSDRKEIYTENRAKFVEKWGPFPRIAFISTRKLFKNVKRAEAVYGDLLELAYKHSSVHYYFIGAPSRRIPELVKFFGKPRLEYMKFKFPGLVTEKFFSIWVYVRLLRLSSNPKRAYDVIVVEDRGRTSMLKSLKSPVYLWTDKGFADIDDAEESKLTLDDFHEACLERARLRIKN